MLKPLHLLAQKRLIILVWYSLYIYSASPIYLREAVTKEEGEKAFADALAILGDNIPVWGDIDRAVFTPPFPELQPEGSLQVPVGGDRDQLLIWQYGEYIPMTTDNYSIFKRSLYPFCCRNRYYSRL